MSIPLCACQARSLESLKKCAALPPSKPAKVRLGSQHPPLLAIDPDHIVLDELHLLLRILDVLIRNLILEMVRLDIENNQRAGGSSGSHLEKLVGTIRDCRISFSVWEKKDADRKPTGVYDWTSLTGADKKKLLSTLPDKLPGILPSDISPIVVQIWKVRCTISHSNSMYKQHFPIPSPPHKNMMGDTTSLLHAVSHLMHFLPNGISLQRKRNQCTISHVKKK